MSENPKKCRVAMKKTAQSKPEFGLPSSARHGATPQLSTGATFGDDEQVRCGIKRISWSDLRKAFLGTEVWSILVTIFLQDGPFFALRVFIVVRLVLWIDTS